jgi:hypothetical protein
MNQGKRGAFMKIRKIILVLLCAVAIILEALPYGVVMLWANPEGEPWRETFSYFDLLPFGYANFGPLITAILTCVITIMCTVFLFCDSKGIRSGIFGLACAATVTSFTPLLLGVEYFSAVGALISTALLAIAVIMKTEQIKTKYKEELL